MRQESDIVKVVVIIIRDKDGNYFVHQRNGNKSTFPNLFGLGAGGHIEKGEDMENAAKRELFEETKLNSDIRFLFSIKFMDDNTNNCVDVFESIIEQTDIGMDREWQWCGWLNKDRVDELLVNDQLCPDTAEIYKKYSIINI